MAAFPRLIREKLESQAIPLLPIHGMNLVEHRPFVSAEDAIRNETDMVSDNILIETAKRRILVADTDIGRELKESIGHLEKLLNAYRDGILIEKGI